jgi:ribosomal protein S6--L-glutamate ligase
MLVSGPDSDSIRFHSRRIARPLAVLPRPGPGNYEDALMVLAHYESIGVPVCNSSQSIALARDTYLSLLEFRKAGLRIPRTARLLSIKDLRIAYKLIPGPPWILKTFTGAMGIGTMLVWQKDQLEAVGATLWALGQPILMQEYIRTPDEHSTDIRTLVIGGKVIGAIRRSAAVGEFRANVHRGGVPEAFRLKRDQKELALTATKAIGLDIAGIDWIETRDGAVVMEANATPGFQGFESATGMDVAAAIIDFAVKKGKSR